MRKSRRLEPSSKRMRAVHVGLARGELRVEDEAAIELLVRQPHRHPRPRRAGKDVRLSVRVDHLEGAGADERLHHVREGKHGASDACDRTARDDQSSFARERARRPRRRAAPTPRRRCFSPDTRRRLRGNRDRRRISQARRDVVVVGAAPAKRRLSLHAPDERRMKAAAARRAAGRKSGAEAPLSPQCDRSALAVALLVAAAGLAARGLALLTALFAALILLLVAILIALVLRLVALLLVLVDLTAALLLVAHRSLLVPPPDRRLAGERSVRRMVPALRAAGPDRAHDCERSRENPASCRHVERFRRCRFRVRGARPGADGDAAIFARLRRMAHDDG